jgi:hypothetical protein
VQLVEADAVADTEYRFCFCSSWIQSGFSGGGSGGTYRHGTSPCLRSVSPGLSGRSMGGSSALVMPSKRELSTATVNPRRFVECAPRRRRSRRDPTGGRTSHAAFNRSVVCRSSRPQRDCPPRRCTVDSRRTRQCRRPRALDGYLCGGGTRRVTRASAPLQRAPLSRRDQVFGTRTMPRQSMNFGTNTCRTLCRTTSAVNCGSCSMTGAPPSASSVASSSVSTWFQCAAT